MVRTSESESDAVCCMLYVVDVRVLADDDEHDDSVKFSIATPTRTHTNRQQTNTHKHVLTFYHILSQKKLNARTLYIYSLVRDLHSSSRDLCKI